MRKRKVEGQGFRKGGGGKVQDSYAGCRCIGVLQRMVMDGGASKRDFIAVPEHAWFVYNEEKGG